MKKAHEGGALRRCMKEAHDGGAVDARLCVAVLDLLNQLFAQGKVQIT